MWQISWKSNKNQGCYGKRRPHICKCAFLEVSHINIMVSKYFPANYDAYNSVSKQEIWQILSKIYELKGLKKIILAVKLFAENLCKEILFKNKRPHNLETLKWICKKIGAVLETSLLRSCGKISSLPPTYWRSSYPKSTTWIAQICYQQTSIITCYWLNNQSELSS